MRVICGVSTVSKLVLAGFLAGLVIGLFLAL